MRHFFFILLFLGLKVSWAQNTSDVVSGNMQFAFDLYQQLSKSNPDQNLFFSPYSISEAMAMTVVGAKNQTKNEISDILHFPSNANELLKEFSELKLAVNKNLDSISFEIASSLWAQKGYDFKPEYFKTVQSNYQAPVNRVNYKKAGARKKAVNEINGWVADNTNKQIKDLIAQHDVTEDTRLVIINAIWFYGGWRNAFSEKLSREDLFTTHNSETKTLFMNRTGDYYFYDDDIIKAVLLPYKGNKQSMIILLPTTKDGINMLEKNLDSYYMQNILKDMRSVRLRLSIPKFTSEFDTDLKGVFQKMGINQAFTNHADFSGMTDKNDLKIDKILHKARIEVSEKGTEAVAATSVIIARKTAFVKELEFKANHPFVYLIRDNETGSILFIGRLTHIGN